jgi:hypothetical protein
MRCAAGASRHRLKVFFGSRPLRSKADAAMEPRMPGRSRCAGGRVDAAMEPRVPRIARCAGGRADTAAEPRVPDQSCAAHRGDRHQVRRRAQPVVIRGRHGLSTKRDQRCCQRSICKGRTGSPGHPRFLQMTSRTTILDGGVFPKYYLSYAHPQILSVSMGANWFADVSGSISEMNVKPLPPTQGLHSVRAGMIVAGLLETDDSPI